VQGCRDSNSNADRWNYKYAVKEIIIPYEPKNREGNET